MDQPTENRNGGSGNELRSWLGDLGLDTAKLGLLLYLLGLITSSLYYSRFSILTLDIAKSQCILVGVYVVILYGAVPGVLLFALKGIKKVGVAGAVFGVVLVVCDLCFGLAVGFRGFPVVWIVLATSVLQFVFFLDLGGLWSRLRSTDSKSPFAFVLSPLKAKALLLALLFCLHFAWFWFPHIPAYFGGGKPISVQVFTKTADLAANRFVQSKNRPQLNQAIDSYSLHLLYETDKDAYFVYELEAADTLMGYTVMRLSKDEILRVDYNTPIWVQWRGAK